MYKTQKLTHRLSADQVVWQEKASHMLEYHKQQQQSTEVLLDVTELSVCGWSAHLSQLILAKLLNDELLMSHLLNYAGLITIILLEIILERTLNVIEGCLLFSMFSFEFWVARRPLFVYNFWWSKLKKVTPETPVPAVKMVFSMGLMLLVSLSMYRLTGY